MNLLDIKNRLNSRKEFNTQDTRRRNIVIKKIEELELLEQQGVLHEEQEGLLVQDIATLSNYIDKCIENKLYVLDLETTGLDCFEDYIVGVCMYTPGMNACYVPLLHTDLDNNILPGQLDSFKVKCFIEKLLKSDAKFINHNLKFDIKFLEQQWDLDVPANNIYWDTKIAAFLLNENEPAHALKPLYDKYILKKPSSGTKFSDLFGKVPFSYIPFKYAKIYGANDGYKTFKLYEFQKQYLDLNHSRPDMQKLAEVFFNIEMPLIPLLVDMELTGVELDLNRAKELEVKYTKLEQDALKVLEDFVAQYETKLHAHKKLAPLIAKAPFNFNSPTQLQIFLYDILKLPNVNKRSTDKKTLEMLLEQATGVKKEFILALQEYKATQKLLSSFIIKLPKEVKQDGAVHGQFNQTGAKTLRFSSSEPNLQQLPSKAQDIRTMFRAREGCVLVGGDLSQIEPRILASLSKDPTMIDSYNTGVDLYSKMASEVYNVPYEQCVEFHPVTGELQKEGKKRRSSVKSLLLGIMYSRGAKSIGEQLGISEKAAQGLIDDFYKTFPRVQELERITKLGAYQNGYVTTLLGSKRRLPELKSKDKWIKARAERQCLNAVIQGTGALLLKKAMLSVYNNPEICKLGAKILMTIHDEQQLEVPKQHAKRVAEILADTMKTVCKNELGLVQKCDVEFAYRWGEPTSDFD